MSSSLPEGRRSMNQGILVRVIMLAKLGLIRDAVTSQSLDLPRTDVHAALNQLLSRSLSRPLDDCIKPSNGMEGNGVLAVACAAHMSTSECRKRNSI